MNYGYDAIPFIDTRDIAACAAVALTRPGHDGQYGVGPVSVPPTDHYWHRPLVVVGGSYIGLEFGQMFGDSDLKSRSSKWHRVSSSARTQKSRRLCRRSCRTKVTVRLNARRLRVSGEASSIVAHVDCEEGSPSIKGSHLLLAVGRRPNTDDLGLDAAGVSRDDGGYIVVNDQLEMRQARLRKRPTTTSRSSRPICSMVPCAASLTGFPPTRCSSIRRLVASASPKRRHKAKGGPSWSRDDP